MYHYQIFFLVFLLGSCFHVDLTQAACTKTSCPPTFSPLTNTKTYAKAATATKTVKVGYLFNDQGNKDDQLSIARMALDEINSNSTFLPDTMIDLYAWAVGTHAETVVATMQYTEMTNNGGMMVSLSNYYSQASQSVASALDVLQLGIGASSNLFADKVQFSTWWRLSPSDVPQWKALGHLVQFAGYNSTIVIAENSPWGLNAYSTFISTISPVRGSQVLIPPNPTAADMVTFNRSMTSAWRMGYKACVILLDADLGWKAIESLNALGFYGVNYLYILSQPITISYVNGHKSCPLMDGTLGVIAYSATAKYNSMLDQWNAVSTTEYPGSRPYPMSDWYPYDGIYTLANTIDTIQKTGKDYRNITQYISALQSTSFDGVNGKILWSSSGKNQNNEKNVTYWVWNFVGNQTLDGGGAGLYSYLNNNITMSSPFIYANGSLIPPKMCICFNGTCQENGSCTCNKGWTGTYCSIRSSYVTVITQKQNMGVKEILPWLLPVVAVLAGCVIFGVWYVRRRRAQIAKEIADRQRSELDRDQIKLGKLIGRGASGEVMLGTFRGTEVAVKRLLTNKASKAILEEFLLETSIMCGLRHPNIVMFMGSCFDRVQQEMLLVMEFMARGSLHDVLHSKCQMPYELQLYLAAQAAQGMNFLHESNPPIIHSDLKSHNILLDDKWTARISDFGITKFKDAKKANKTEASASALGTVFWTAPEVLNGKTSSEASDCYSFGIVLWEIFHRQDPYPGKDLVAVAVDVIARGIRPDVHPGTPMEMQELMKECWSQDPAQRPTFAVIMTRLRALSSQHPMLNFSSVDTRVSAPTGNVYLVYGIVPGLYELFDSIPRATRDAVAMMQNVQHNTLETYAGYEAKHNEKSFLAVFKDVYSAVNFCTAFQTALLRLDWPHDVLKHPRCAEKSTDGATISRGLNVRMSIISGVPKTDMDHNAGRMSYSGAEVDLSVAMLNQNPTGSIITTSKIVNEINGGKADRLIEKLNFAACGSACEDPEYYRVVPNSLASRENEVEEFDYTSIPNYISVEGLSSPSQMVSPRSKWIVPVEDLVMHESIGRGAVGDYSRATWNGREVAVKLLVNQKLSDKDFLQLISDAAILSKIDHPNLLKVFGICIDPSHISVILDYGAKGNLRKALSEELIPMPMNRCLKIAIDIAKGVQFLSNHPDHELRIYDNFKSHNIMLTKDWDVKVTDFGQRSIKDLARTMTSIGSVAWTAPEILNGDPCTDRCAMYSFAIILWELFTRLVPYENEHPIKVVTKILKGFRPPLPADTPSDLKELVESCWHQDPSMRPSWSVIINELTHIHSRY